MMRRLIIVTCLIALALVSGSARAQDVISTFAGGGPNNLPAISANVDQPTSVAVATSGVFYIASPSQNRVFKVDTSGTPQLTVIAGNGTPGYSGDAGLAVNASLRSPQAVAVDSLGNVFIADTQNNVVRKVDTTGTITTVAGNGGSGFSGDGGAATSAKLARPFGLAIDGAGNIYIADIDNNRVRKVDTSGTITTVAGNGAAGFSGDGGPATVASLNQPMSVALDSAGNIYISDGGNHRVRKVGATLIITTVAGNGTSGSNTINVPATSVGLSGRLGVVLDGATPADIFIADADDGLVREVNGTTQNITTVAGNGCFGYSLDSSCNFNVANGDGTSAKTASLNGPLGVAVDVSGNVYIADTGNLRVRKFVVAGNINTVAGNGLTYSGDNSPALNASLKSPQGVAAAQDGSGSVFIADSDGNLVRKVDIGGTITTIAGNGCFGYQVGNAVVNVPKCDKPTDLTAGDGNPAINASLGGPTGVAQDRTGNLFIADASNQRIRKVDTSGNINTVAGNGCHGFAVGNPPSCNTTNDVSAGDGVFATSASLNFPSSVAVDGSGNIFIADTDNHRIRKVDTTGTITTVAGNGCQGFAVGSPPLCNTTNDVTAGNGVLATSASLNFPSGVALDTSGNLYIADQSNQRIRRVDAATQNITTVAGNGFQGYSGDGRVATSAMLNFPAAVALDGFGNLFIADFGNQRIRRVDAATQVITTVAGDGSFGFSGDLGPATLAMLANPGGLTVDGSGNLLLADTFNDRIRKVASPVVPAAILLPTSLSFPAQLFGTTSAPLTLTLSNTGNATLNISSIAIITGDFGQTPTCGPSLAPGANCSISVTFTPTGLGTRTGALAINDDAQGSPQTVNLSGTGVQPTAIPSPTSLTFLANQLVGTTSAAQTVTLSNTGTTTLAITSILSSGDFAVASNTCGSTLAVSATCTFGVTFTPTTTGSRSGAITLTDNAGNSPQVINLTGTGIAPSVALSQTNLTFGNQGVGSTSLPLGVALTSTGTAPLLISSIAATGDFAETNNCGASVAPPTTCTINVTFTPTANGTRSGTLTISDDASGSPQVVTLSGVGVLAYSLVADRTSATVLKGTDSAIFNFSASSPYNFTGGITLSCSGNSPAACAFNPASISAGQNSVLTVSNLNSVTGSSLNFTVTGTSGSQSSSVAITIFIADFSIAASSPTATVTAGQTATYTLTIQPSGGFSQPISLNCSGAPLAATCSVSPSSVAPDGVHPITATVSVTTTALSPAEVNPFFTAPGTRGPKDLPLFFGLVFASGIAMYISIRRRQMKFLLALLVLSAITWIACGGGGSSPLPILKGTPGGTYTLNVTANSGGLNHNLNLGLNVN